MHSHIYGTVIFRKKPYLSLLFFKSQGKPTVSATNFSIFLWFLKKKKNQRSVEFLFDSITHQGLAKGLKIFNSLLKIIQRYTYISTQKSN